MAISNPPVPTLKAGVTRAWLKFALADTFPDATFASLEQRRIGEAYGFASHILRCQWQENGAHKSVVVKLWDTVTKAGTGELRFYQTFSDVGLRIPKCYYGAADEKTNKAVLVLEDLTDVVQGDVLERLDLERATGVARALAGLHATWLEHPDLNELTWLTDVSTWSPEREWIASRRSLFLERFSNHLSGLSRLLLDKLELAPRITNERLADAPKTLLHGDFHLDNIVFERQVEPVLLDWSRPVKGPLALNLAVLLFTMTPLKYFDEVFEQYVDAFKGLSGRQLNSKKLARQLGGELLRLFATSTCGIARWQPSRPREKRIIEDSVAAISRSVDFCQERDPALFSFLY